MCGRSTLTKTEQELEERFKSTFYSDDLERYNGLPSFNIAPTQFHPIITNDEDHFSLMKWGLIPTWAKDPKIGSKMINARLETIEEKVSFKALIHQKRCIVPFDGYYEWQKHGSQKIPYYIFKKDHTIFSLAGIWTEWINDQNEKIKSFSILTTSPTGQLSKIHHRKPCFLSPSSEYLWIDNKMPFNEAKKLLINDEEDKMTYHRVRQKVNNIANNNSSLIKPDNTPLPPTQGTLF